MRTLDLDTLILKHGSHKPPSNGLVDACVMEAVAYVAGEPWSDHPECVSPVVGAFLRSWNDSLDDADRQMLKPYILRVVGTNTGERDDETRSWLATDWLVREYAPAWLRLAGLIERAEQLERLAVLDSSARAKEAQPALNAAKREAVAAGAAALAAGAAAAWAPAAWAAARAAAGAAAGDAAWAALQPTTRGLQKSALLLLDRMILVGREAAA